MERRVSDPTTNPSPPAEEVDSFEELDRQVEELLQEVQEACASFDEQMSDERSDAVSKVEQQMLDALSAGDEHGQANEGPITGAESETPPISASVEAPAGAASEDASGGDEPVAEAEATATESPLPEPAAETPSESAPEAAAPVEPVGDDTSDEFAQVDALLEDVMSASAEASADPAAEQAVPSAAETNEPEASTPEAPSATDEVPAVDAESIDALDEQLAHLTDALLEGDAVDQQAESREPAAPSAEVVEPAPTPEPEPQPVESAPPEEPPKVKAPSPAPAKPKAPATGGDWKRRSRVAAAWMQEIAGDTAHAAAPVLARSLVAVSKPLDRAPASVRDTIGYIGVVTAFWALVMWGYVLFVQAPKTERATTGLVTITSPEDAGAVAPVEGGGEKVGTPSR